MTSVGETTNIVDFSVGSMPTSYGGYIGYDESYNGQDDSSELQFKPRILIMGLRRLILLEINKTVQKRYFFNFCRC